MIYSGLGFSQYTSDIYGNSSHRKATGSRGKGASKGEMLALSASMNRAEEHIGVWSKPCSWSARREMFQKRPCVSAGATEDSGLLSADTAQQIRVK